MKKALIVSLYTFAVGLAGQGWLSSILPRSTQIMLTVGALLLAGLAFALQAKWQKDLR